MGHDRLDPKAADHSPVLTKIKELNPELIYYGGDAQAGVKVVKQSYDIVPKMLKGGGDGLYGPSILSGAGFPAANGWYCTVACPHMMQETALGPWVKRFAVEYSLQASDYSITAYDAAQVAMDAIRRVANSAKPVTRDAVHEALMTTKLQKLQGVVLFDANGDVTDHVVSIFQVQHDPKYPTDDIVH